MKTHFCFLLALAFAVPLSGAPFARAEENVSQALPSESPRAWSLTPRLRAVQAFYREELRGERIGGRRSVDQTLLETEVEGALPLGAGDWSLGGQVSATVALIRDSYADAIGFFNARAFASYAAMRQGAWTLSPAIGAAYATTYGRDDAGYRNSFGPEAGLALRRVTARGDVASLYGRAGMFMRDFGDWRLGAGFSYLFAQPGTDRGFEFSAELSVLRVSTDVVFRSQSLASRIQVSTVSLGLGYRF